MFSVFVCSRSISLLQCLSMIHKTWSNPWNDEIWRLLLLEQTPTFGELDKTNNCRIVEKEISLPDICCSKDRSEMNFLKITRTWCSTELIFSILTQVNLSKSKHYSMKTFEKSSMKFYVTSLTKWQKVLLIFRNIGRSITDENSFHFLLSKHFFSKYFSFTKISSTFISFINFLLKFYNQK